MTRFEFLGIRIKQFKKKKAFRHVRKMTFPFSSVGYVLQARKLIIVEVGSLYKSERLVWYNADAEDVKRYLRGG